MSRVRVLDDQGEAPGRQMTPPSERENPLAQAPFEWDVPEGWQESASVGMLRLANFRFGDSGECYFGVMNGDGGGLLANVNRWRGQMGLEGLTEEELAALPRGELIGVEAVEIDLEGSFSGMGATQGKDGYRMKGKLAVRPDMTFFVKMTAPAADVEAHEAAYDGFCESIRFRQAEPEEAPNPFVWTGPSGWREVASTGPLRAANYVFGEGDEGECYFGVVTGGGGLLANVNRWRGQMGLEAIGEDDLGAMNQGVLMGEDAVQVDLAGTFTKMGAAEGKPGYRMLGRILVAPGFTFYVKMTGPEELVAEQQEAFDAFCQTIDFRGRGADAGGAE